MGISMIRRLLHPFPSFPFLNGHVFSPTDALAERLGMGATERAFALPAAQRVARALVRYFGDAEAERAMKKEYHRVIEHRLRAVAITADPTENHGVDPLRVGPLVNPMDAVALAELQAADAAVSAPVAVGSRQRLQHRLGLITAALGLIGMALLPLRHARRHVTPRVTKVAAANFGRPDLWLMLRSAAQDTVGWRDGDLVFILEDQNSAHLLRGGPFPTLEPSRLPVALVPWLRQAVLPSLRLAATILADTLAARDPRVIEIGSRTLNLAARSLGVRRALMNVRCRWFIDTEDNSSLHLLRGMLLRKQGGGVVRWPYTQNETPGVFSSYLGYDLFPSGGDFHWRHYRDTWYPGLRSLAIGQTRNDHRIKAALKVKTEYREAIEARLARGQRMAVYFGGNTGVGFERPMLDSLAVLLAEIAERPDWFLVVKPKFREALYELCAKDPRFDKLFSADNVLLLHYGSDGAEVCPAGWLIDHMHLGLTLPGSVQWEALTGGRVMFCYWPTIQQGESRRLLRDAGLLHDHLDRLRSAIRSFAETPDAFSYPLEDIRRGFDPFNDDRAFERLAAALFQDDAPRPSSSGDVPMSLSLPHRMLSWVLARSHALKTLSPDLYMKAAVKIRAEMDLVERVRNRNGDILIYCESEMVRSRAEKMPTREPATLAWVESFQPDDVFWDIGCNIGVFTLYASVCSKARVVAFDPLPFNYSGLSRNLALNGVTDRVQAFCCAISDTTCATKLYIPAVAYTPGGSGSTIGAEPGAFGKEYGVQAVQSAFQFSVDDLVAQFGLPVPTHIKIDIDGVQDKVIIGARKTLRDPRLRSLMIELPPRAEIIASVQAELAEAGLVVDKISECSPGGGTDMSRIDTNHFYKRP